MRKLNKLFLLLTVCLFAGELAMAYGGYSKGFSSALKIPFLLLTLAGGYWLLVYASKQKKPLNRVGQLISIIIILVSLGGVICAVACKACAGKWGCSYKADKGGCPFHQKAPEEIKK